MYVIVNGEPRLRNESAEVRQLRSELLVMRDKVWHVFYFIYSKTSLSRQTRRSPRER